MISMMINDDEKDNHHHNRIIRVDEGHSLNPTSPTIASGHVDNHGAFGVFAVIMIGMIIIFLLCCPTGGGPRLDHRARIHFRQVHFGVFSTSCFVFVPLTLSSDWT